MQWPTNTEIKPLTVFCGWLAEQIEKQTASISLLASGKVQVKCIWGKGGHGHGHGPGPSWCIYLPCPDQKALPFLTLHAITLGQKSGQ